MSDDEMRVRRPIRGPRSDVLSDAGREVGDLYPIAFNLSSTEAWALRSVLQRHGWIVELAEPITGSQSARACDAARSTRRPSGPRESY
jgi:hypothetical protein